VRPTTTTRPDRELAGTAAYVDELAAVAGRAGITRTGVAPASVLGRARRELHRRAAAGLADDMAFTYRNPERSTDPGAAVADAAAVFVGARPYVATEPRRPGGVTGRIARYAWDDHVGALRDGLWAVARRLRADGWKAVAYADDNSIVDREVAHLAGIGWFGKNANLLVPGAGSWFVLGCVVTTAPLPVAVAPVADGCGACRRCIDQCPTGAIVEPGVVDARRCLSWLLQKPGIIAPHWRVAIGDRLYGCDDCQEACPPTVRGGRTAGAGTVVPAAAYVDVLALLAADDAAVLDGWGRRYLTDRDPRWARRNALVVLGNAARGDDPDVVATLTRYVAEHDPALRIHAIWAARRLGLDRLVPDAAAERDPDVRAELALVVEARCIGVATS
jgi:epoxyqueuosine reductase